MHDLAPASSEPIVSASSTTSPPRAAIDVRGPRFGATVTAVLLATALVLQGTVGLALLTLQAVVFGIAVALGVTRSPWAALFRVVRDRLDLGPPPATEDPAPPRFAQACGLLIAGGGLVAVLAGASTLGWVLVGVVLALSTLLAATGLCVGCELYLAGLRLRARLGARR